MKLLEVFKEYWCDRRVGYTVFKEEKTRIIYGLKINYGELNGILGSTCCVMPPYTEESKYCTIRKQLSRPGLEVRQDILT